MFELPDSKRVRREDLYGPGNDDDHEAAAAGAEVSLSADAEHELRSRLNAQFSGLFDFGPALSSSTAVDVDTAAAPAASAPEAPVAEDDAAPAAAEDPDELTFEFRLFRDEAPTHTVVIQRNEDRPGAQGEGGFVVPKRPNSYYLAAAPGAALMEQLRLTAVSSEFLLADARRNRWGLEKPWRVTHISITGRPLSRKSATPSLSTTSPETRAAAGGDGELAEEKRKRPGKKRRIILRTREKARKEKAEAAKKLLESKEEQLKAKKKRLNREKKLKRRAKEKEKKGAAAGTSEKGDTEMVDDVSDDGSDD